ncbi:MAG: hypothetical protein J6R92_02580 [Akkermansia sp.]|nr:hypothetical protein [Akkermansia sp.]
MNKNYKDSIPDWLPPALVKDWRQMLRTPLFMLGLLALGLLSFGFLLLPEGEVLDKGNYMAFVMMGTVVLCGLVPARVSQTVEGETKNPGTNFIRLTPLSSWQVVWGTWLSGAVQVVMLALLALPLVAMRMGNAPAGQEGLHLAAHLLLILLLMLQGWTMVALAQASSALPMVLRLFVFVSLLGSICGMDCEMVGVLLREQVSQFAGMYLLSVAALGVMLLTLLAEARRQYAHPAEDCVTAVRWFSMLAVVLYGAALLLNLLGLLGDCSWGCYGWAVWFVLGMAVWEVLHPVIGSHRGLLISGKSGMWGGVVWFSVAVGVCMLAGLPLLWTDYQEWQTLAYISKPLPPVYDLLTVYAYAWLTLLVGVLAALLLSQIFRRHSAGVFAAVLMLGVVVQGLDSMVAGLLPVPSWELLAMMAHLHMCDADRIELVQACSVVQVVWLVLLLAIFRSLTWRK